jgi:serine/threonine protein kinase/tetratricopeptide (TPR) repeat protein
LLAIKIRDTLSWADSGSAVADLATTIHLDSHMTNSDDHLEADDPDSTQIDADDSVDDGRVSDTGDPTNLDDNRQVPSESDATQDDDCESDGQDAEFDDSATVVDDTVADPPSEKDDGTVVDPDSEKLKSGVTVADQTVDVEAQTIVDSSIEPPADPDGTVVDGGSQTDGNASNTDNDQFAQTIVDSQLIDPDRANGSGGVDSSDETQQTVQLPDDESDSDRTMHVAGDGEENPDRTVIESSSGQPEGPVADADADATQFDSSSSLDADGTQLDGDDFDATQIQSEDDQHFDATFDEHATQITSGDSPDYSNDQTQISDETSDAQKFKGRSKKRKAAHATADRWEQQQRYELVTNFARGGLGQIWIAQDVRLKREVAFKELLPNALRNSSALERFLEEAQITGQLEHPGIVPIYDIGYQANGTPFYSMKLVRGETMEKYIEEMHELAADSTERTLQFRKLLRSFIDICNAMAFAHDRGVLHRDLKPLNVMIGAFGETLVLDWGLAKIIGVDTLADDHTPLVSSTDGPSVDGETVIEDGTKQAATGTGATSSTGTTAKTSGGTAAHSQAASLVDGQSQAGSLGTTRRMVVTDVRTAGSQTMTGSVMGTPAYMPPEQARGDIDSLDARCDIYALGGILYKLLTNHQPIGRGKLKQVLHDVKEGNILPPRKRDPSIEKPLEAVCMKALATKEDDRYRSALLLAADVEAWLADEPVSVFEEPFTVRFRRWRKKNRTAVASSTVAAALMVVVWIGSVWSHGLALDAIRADVGTHVEHSATALTTSNFVKAKDEITEALGRSSSEPDLSDLTESLNARLDLIESKRIADLRSSAEAKLADSVILIDANRYEDARTKLVELSTLLRDDSETLADLSAEIVRRVQEVETKLNEQADIADTATNFRKFEELVDNARTFGNIDALNALADDDAKLALSNANDALKVFGLGTGEKPNLKYFSNDLEWTKRYHERTSNWPEDVLKQATFDMLVNIANVESHMARNADPAARKTVVLSAINTLGTAIQLDVGSFAASAMQAGLYESIDLNDQANAIGDRLKEQSPETFQDFFLLGNNERVRFFTESALGNFELALRKKPGDFWTQHHLALCHLKLGHHRAALAYLTNCISQRPDIAWVRMQRGLCHLEMRDYKSALAEFNEAEKKDPNLFHVYVNRGATHVKLDNFPQAVADFRKAAALEPTSAIPIVNIATVHLETAAKIQAGVPPFDQLDFAASVKKQDEEINAALLELAKAEKLAPNNSLLHERKGEALRRQERKLEAKASYQKSAKLERDPTRRCETLKVLATMEFQDLAYEKARTLFEAANAANPNDAESLFYIAECYLNENESASAIEYYNKVLQKLVIDIKTKLKPPEVLFNGMAMAYSQLAQQPKAMQYFSLSLMFKDDHAHSLTRRGWAYISYANSLAEEDFRSAVKADPNDADAQIGIAYALVMQRKVSDALVELDKGLKLTTQAIVRESKRQRVDIAKLAEYYKLHHNAATVYAQAIIHVRDQAQRKQLATKSLEQLSQAFAIAKLGKRQRQMLGGMINDTALGPVRIVSKEDFEALFNKLKQQLPTEQK